MTRRPVRSAELPGRFSFTGRAIRTGQKWLSATGTTSPRAFVTSMMVSFTLYWSLPSVQPGSYKAGRHDVVAGGESEPRTDREGGSTFVMVPLTLGGHRILWVMSSFS